MLARTLKAIGGALLGVLVANLANNILTQHAQHTKTATVGKQSYSILPYLSGVRIDDPRNVQITLFNARNELRRTITSFEKDLQTYEARCRELAAGMDAETSAITDDGIKQSLILLRERVERTSNERLQEARASLVALQRAEAQSDDVLHAANALVVAASIVAEQRAVVVRTASARQALLQQQEAMTNVLRRISRHQS